MDQNEQFSKTTEELNVMADQLLREVKEMQKNLAALGRVKFVRPSVDELLAEGHKWETWYAWRPVKDIHGVWHWGKDIYRLRGNTFVDHDNWSWYHYGTVFDVLSK